MPILSGIIQQHVEEAGALYACRTTLCAAPNSALRYLRRFDDRLVGHLYGLSVAGAEGSQFSQAELHTPSAGALFVVAVGAIEERHEERLSSVLAIAEAVPDTTRGLLAAFGWVEPQHLQGLVATLLTSADPFRRLAGIAACALHRIESATTLARRIHDQNHLVRARSLRAAGELGRPELLAVCGSAITDEDAECKFWALWSAVILGTRGSALEELTAMGLGSMRHRGRALRLALQAMNPAESHRVLQQLAGDPGNIRWLIQGSGIAGDAAYVPWLLKHVSNDQTARVAGEAFSLIAGTDLALLDLERKPPDNFESGPNNDPNDPNVDMDPDDGLPWPDLKKVEAWWHANEGRFQKGTRYFMGKPVTRDHCIDVLKNGYQRQRILAAHYLCLLEPGTPLFNTSAPAWRQQRLLAAM